MLSPNLNNRISFNKHELYFLEKISKLELKGNSNILVDEYLESFTNVCHIDPKNSCFLEEQIVFIGHILAKKLYLHWHIEEKFNTNLESLYKNSHRTKKSISELTCIINELKSA